MPSWRHSHAPPRHSRRRSASQPALLDGFAVVDTLTADPEDFYNVARPGVGFYVTSHVTDNPSGLIAALDSGKDLVEMNPDGDLGGGFYGSNVPQLWMGRSIKKWDYLDTMTRDQRQALFDYIFSRRDYQPGGFYLTESELSRMKRDLTRWVDDGFAPLFVMYANQPYNVRIPQSELDKLGIHPFEPSIVKVWFKGKFVDLTNSSGGIVPVEKWRGLVDGAFTRMSMGTEPQLVIWNRNAISEYREAKE